MADIVDVRVLAEYSFRISVVALQRRASKTDEGGIGDGIAHPACTAIKETVLTTVGFIRKYHDIGAFTDRRAAFSELLDSRKHYAARGPIQPCS